MTGNTEARPTGARRSSSSGGGRGRPAKPAAPRQPAAVDPVAQVVVDVPLAHLDRPFDYLVPDTADDSVRAGSRVRVRFAGQLVDGIVLRRVDRTEHGGRLAFVERAVSPEVVLTPEIAGLARAVADRWAGNLVDVLRLAVPPRHARVEGEAAKAASADAGAGDADASGSAETPTPLEAPVGVPVEVPVDPPPTPEPGQGWARYPTGVGFVSALAGGRAAHAVWTALPGEDWPARIAEAARAMLSAGRGALVVVPDHRDLTRVQAAMAAEVGPERCVSLSADVGPAERYRRWLRVVRGQVRVVVGTRAAAYSPVADLGLIVIWDDGDDLYAEPRAPYAHARDVLVLRAHRTGAAVLLGAHARSVEAQQLVASGWAHPLGGDRAEIRRAVPRVVPVGDDTQLARDEAARSARLPSVALQAARSALADGRPVLVQVPRRGYVPALACAACRTPARCSHCGGPLGQTDGDAATPPSCRWCGRPAVGWTCGHCGGRRLRAVVVGARRTAEELGRAFPGASVRTSGGPTVLDRVPAEPALVVATPGAEPLAEGGYGAALLLDSWALLTRPDLRAAEETLRRWANAVALVRPAADGGQVVVSAEAGLSVVQALLRWDPGWLAERELAERTELGFPPARRFAAVRGTPAAVREVLDVAHLPDGADLLGPVPDGTGEDAGERMLVRVDRGAGAALARALHDAQAVRSARKAPDTARVQLDPVELF